MTVTRAVAARVLALLVIGALAPRSAGGQQGPSADAEAQARRWYANGVKNLEAARTAEGLRDLRTIVETYPTSTVADDALLAIAEYQLEQLRDLPAAQATIKTLTESYPYPGGDATPVAYVLQGRLSLAGQHTPEELEKARAAFDRVANVFPGTNAVPMALFYLGEVERERRRFGEAIEAYTRVVTGHRNSPWAARSQLGSAQCRVAMRQPIEAMDTLQRLRQRFIGTPEAERARDWNSILYRLYIRPPAEPAYVASDQVFAFANGKIDTVVGIVTHPGGEVTLALKSSGIRFDYDLTVLGRTTTNNVRSLGTTREGEPVLVLQDGLQPFRGNALRLSTPKADGTPKFLDDILAASGTTDGRLIVADGSSKSLLRFEADGRYVDVFAPLRADRLALNGSGDLAALDRGEKTVVVLNRQGRSVGRVPQRGTGYELRNPVDVAWDALGHLYVLDRDAALVLVFGPGQSLVTTFTLPERSAGSFRRATALGVDEAGRLFIYDQRTEQVRVYQ